MKDYNFLTWVAMLVLLGILVFFMIEVSIMSAIHKQIKQNATQIPDERYFELKYRIHFLVWAFGLIVILGALSGYNTLLDIRTDLYQEANKSLLEERKVRDEFKASYDSLLENSVIQFNKSVTRINELQSITQGRVRSLDNIASVYQNLLASSVSRADTGKVMVMDLRDLKLTTSPGLIIQATDGSIEVTELTKHRLAYVLHGTKGRDAQVTLLLFSAE